MRSRVTAALSSKLECHLLAYATAARSAAAVAVAVGAATVTAEAKVVYTPIHERTGGRYNLDLNHDGIKDFIISTEYGCDTDGCYDFLNASAFGGNGVEAHSAQARALRRGARVGPGKDFDWINPLMCFRGSNSDGSKTSGHWCNVKKRYLGLRFDVNGHTHYGWARFNVSIGDLVTATITGYAYETTPNHYIVTGDEGTGAKSLGHLALGAADKKQNRRSPVPGR